MVSIEVLLLGLLIISTLTGLTTEAFKVIFTENNVTYQSNTLAGLVALILSIAIGVGYVVVTGVGFTTQIITCLVAEMFMSWLCAMVGYDKVIQAISQFKTSK